MNHTILLTIDVEDWFQVENFKKCIPFTSWSNCELRVEKNVHRILDLLDSIKLNNPVDPKNVSCESASRKGLTHNSKPATRNNGSASLPPSASRLTPYGEASPCAMPSALCRSPKATFFVLGWVAERLPHLVREIQSRGHEIASHGYSHELCQGQAVECLREDLTKSKRLLEDITGNPVYGYRAPSFSISDHVLNLIREAGYLYDSSFNSFGLNKRYGKIEPNGNVGNGILHKISETFYEIPISNVKFGGKVLPWGGGGYFRLIPGQLFKYGVQSILKSQGTYLFYLHPWEIDPGQPRISQVPKSSKFRHYLSLSKTENKLLFLIDNFKNFLFETCYQHITQHTTAALQHRKTAAH
jgi:polysaccharide deacetylase family protein (PEP-CTERM system associated)